MGVESLRSRLPSVARARCSALFTEATVVSRSSRDLFGLPVQDLAEDQHGSLAGRQVLERRDEGEAHGLAGDRDLRGIGFRGHDSCIRHRLEPGALGEPTIERRIGGQRGVEVHGPRAALARSQHVEADVRRDAIEPRSEAGAAFERRHAAPRADERLLHGVLRLEGGAEHAVAVGGELHAVALEVWVQGGDAARGRLSRSSGLAEKIGHGAIVPGARRSRPKARGIVSIVSPPTTPAHPAHVLAAYDRVIATQPGLVRKGAKLPYTSLNGNMSSYLAETGDLVLRLGPAEREAFLARYGTGLHVAHGTVQKEYVDVPAALLEATDELAPWFAASVAFVGGLRAKPTTRGR